MNPQTFSSYDICLRKPRLWFVHEEWNNNYVPRPIVHHLPLTNEINPIWRRKAFRYVYSNFPFPSDYGVLDECRFDMQLDMYNKLRPALQLASILLERARELFLQIYTAPCHVDNGRSVLDTKYVPSLADEAHYDNLLSYVTLDYRLLIKPPTNSGNSEFTFATTAMVVNLDPYAPNIIACVGDLAIEMMTALDDPDWYSKPELERETALLSFAQTLIHEFAHVVWFKRREHEGCFGLQPYLMEHKEEPMFPGVGFAELGHYTSKFLFGSELMLNCPPRTIEGTQIPDFSGRTGIRATRDSIGDHGSLSSLRISDRTVHDFFNFSTFMPSQVRDGIHPVQHLWLLQDDSKYVPAVTNGSDIQSSQRSPDEPIIIID